MVRYKINAISAYFDKKGTRSRIYCNQSAFFILLVLFLSKFTEIAFILYLTTNFHMAMKNPILGIFSQKFT